jgi:hypothetical protein
MATKVRVNLANALELLELPGLGPAEVRAIVRYRAEHGPIQDERQLAQILPGWRFDEAFRDRLDFEPTDGTSPEAPGA